MISNTSLKKTKKEKDHESRKPFVLMWAEQASVDSLSNANSVFTQAIEGTLEELRRERRSKF